MSSLQLPVRGLPRRAIVLALALGTIAVLAGCAGNTTRATDITENSAQLNAIGTCALSDCSAYMRWRRVGNTDWTKGPTTKIGSNVSNVSWSQTATGLAPDTHYEYQACGQEKAFGDNFVCAGPDGKGSSTETFVTTGASESTGLGGGLMMARINNVPVGPEDYSLGAPVGVSEASKLYPGVPPGPEFTDANTMITPGVPIVASDLTVKVLGYPDPQGCAGSHCLTRIQLYVRSGGASGSLGCSLDGYESGTCSSQSSMTIAPGSQIAFFTDSYGGGSVDMLIGWLATPLEPD